MAHRACPWWMGYFLLSPIRRLRHDPKTILSPWVRDGMTVLEPGPGMGFFTIELARMVGKTGRVVAVDVEPRMLDALRRRARRAGVMERVQTMQADASGMDTADLRGRVDFVLAFAVVHELPDVGRFFRDSSGILKPGGTILFAEPADIVGEDEFQTSLRAAEGAGLYRAGAPSIPSTRAALLLKS
jgi:ubiquinone/menaquinone biosynthesis C-methylase UbiE